MTEKLKVHDHLECFGRKVAVVCNGYTENGERQARVYQGQRFPFAAYVIEGGAENDWRRSKWHGHLTVFNTPIPLCQVDFVEGQEPEDVVKLLEFAAVELIKDMNWLFEVAADA